LAFATGIFTWVLSVYFGLMPRPFVGPIAVDPSWCILIKIEMVERRKPFMLWRMRLLFSGMNNSEIYMMRRSDWRGSENEMR
jgi:hypothetical protein